MTNSELSAMLKAVEIITRLADTKENATKYIIEIEETLKKPAEPHKAPAD